MDGRVQIAANKGDVTVQDEKGTTTVTQGQQTTGDETTERNRGSASGRWRNHEFAAGSLRRIGRDWRGYDLDIETVGTCGESRVPVELLPVILLRPSSCREF